MKMEQYLEMYYTKSVLEGLSVCSCCNRVVTVLKSSFILIKMHFFDTLNLK